MEEIINYVNENHDVYNLTLKFSTVTNYMNSLNEQKNNFLQRQGGDFLPYDTCKTLLFIYYLFSVYR
jgi:hypothetical protein